MFEIEFAAVADAELLATYRYIRRKNPHAANAWLIGIRAAIYTLRMMPERCGRAAEAATTGLDVRELLYGKRQGTFRILFTIGSRAVLIRRVARANRRPIPPSRF
jgi:plasmid stabilization system protein ParE